MKKVMVSRYYYGEEFWKSRHHRLHEQMSFKRKEEEAKAFEKQFHSSNSVGTNCHIKLEDDNPKMTGEMCSRPLKKRKIEYELLNVEAQG